MTSAQIRIHYGDELFDVPVTPETTLAQILAHIGLDAALFTKEAHAPVFVNEGETGMPWLDRTMLYYNNWHITRGYIPSLHIKRRADVEHLCDW
jgi:hypothetical protein